MLQICRLKDTVHALEIGEIWSHPNISKVKAVHVLTYMYMYLTVVNLMAFQCRLDLHYVSVLPFFSTKSVSAGLGQIISKLIPVGNLNFQYCQPRTSLAMFFFFLLLLMLIKQKKTFMKITRAMSPFCLSVCLFLKSHQLTLDFGLKSLIPRPAGAGKLNPQPLVYNASVTYPLHHGHPKWVHIRNASWQGFKIKTWTGLYNKK